jgi:hypothetical protein
MQIENQQLLEERKCLGQMVSQTEGYAKFTEITERLSNIFVS